MKIEVKNNRLAFSTQKALTRYEDCGRTGNTMAINLDRHARHILLKEIGGPGQKKLSEATALIIGVGGLGGPAALFLAAAGIKRLRLVDPDTVSLDNLQRQILFRTDDIGRAKTDAASDALTALDPAIEIETIAASASSHTLPELLNGIDLVLDGCDDFETRFAVNAAAVAAGVPLVSGAIGRWDGQLGVFAPSLAPEAACYQCWVPAPPPDAERCAEVGVVGALTGVIGAAIALETIKLITGAGEPLVGRLMLYDGLSGNTRTVVVKKDPACPCCSSS